MENTNNGPSPLPSFDVEVFFDGECPLCAREISLLRRLDRKSRIHFVDISAKGFDPAAVGLSQETLMAELHARLPDGTIIRGVEVFRRLYSAVGFRGLVAASRWPGVSQSLDFGYAKFAKNRLRLTGRCSAESCAVPGYAEGSR